MDKTKYGKIALGIFGLHTILTIISLVCSMSNNHKVFQFGFNMGGFVLVIYPLIGGFTYIVISLIGMIKNKKLLPYLICPIISFFLWLVLGGALAVYI